MAAIPGSVRVAGFIAPTDDTDTYAVHDEIYGKGGWRTVADISARDAIPTARRNLGMGVRVLDDGTGNQRFYTFKTGLTNSDWEIDTLGGEWSGAYSTAFVSGSVDLIDEQAFTIVEISTYTTAGVAFICSVTPTTNTGIITAELFDDVAKTRLIGTLSIDLAAPTLRFTIALGFELETTGTIYGTLYCSGVPSSQTAIFSIEAIITSPQGGPEPLPSPYGDGIEDDGLGKPQVALSSTGGLAFSAGKLVVAPDITAAATVSLSASGVAVTGVVTDSTDQSISAKKVFDSVGCIPSGNTGAPTSGTYATGAEILDSVNIKWRCTEGGTPGTWELADSILEFIQPMYSSVQVALSDTYLFELPVTGNTGVLLWLRVWAYPTATSNVEIPFRVRIYQTSSALGREMIWQGFGIARQTALTAQLPGAQTYLVVSSNDLIEVDEGLVVFEDDTRYEFGRCSNRSSGYIGLAESLVDPDTWDIGTRILPVSEWSMVPWINTDGDPDKKNKVFIQVKHVGLVSDPALTFYVDAKVFTFGVIAQEIPT
jgi:hypothetical protein